MRILALTLDLDDTLWPVWPALERADLAIDDWLRQHHPEVARAWPIAAMRKLRAHVAAARGNAGRRANASLAAVNSIAAAQYRSATPAAPVQPRTDLNDVRGSVAGVNVTSLAQASGSATTVNDAAISGAEFRRVSADASVSASSDGRAGRIYTVAKGDTLSSIARKHAVEVTQLREWNHLRDNQIRLGQRLRVGR